MIKERPGEPRFGFDVERDGAIQTVNDLAGTTPCPAAPTGDFVAATSLAAIDARAARRRATSEKTDQRADDLQVVTAAAERAPRWAYILYQAPVMVAVHAAEMLPPPT